MSLLELVLCRIGLAASKRSLTAHITNRHLGMPNGYSTAPPEMG
jgi:hypothetical protein